MKGKENTMPLSVFKIILSKNSFSFAMSMFNKQEV